MILWLGVENLLRNNEIVVHPPWIHHLAKDFRKSYYLKPKKGGMMELPTGYRLENVWENKSVELKEEIIKFWLHVRALQTRKEAEDRVDQVIFIIRYTNNDIIAVSTVFKQFNKQLNHDFYYFRCFVSREHRRKNLSAVLIVNARDFLNERFIYKKNTDVIGMFLVIENEILKNKRNEAIWPNSKFVFVGKNDRGDPLRVFYFDGARIS